MISISDIVCIVNFLVIVCFWVTTHWVGDSNHIVIGFLRDSDVPQNGHVIKSIFSIHLRRLPRVVYLKGRRLSYLLRTCDFVLLDLSRPIDSKIIDKAQLPDLLHSLSV